VFLTSFYSFLCWIFVLFLKKHQKTEGTEDPVDKNESH